MMKILSEGYQVIKKLQSIGYKNLVILQCKNNVRAILKKQLKQFVHLL